MQTACRVNYNYIGIVCHGGFKRVECHRCRVGAHLLLDDSGAGALSPDGELLDGGSAESVGGTEDDLFALVTLRELSTALMRRIRGNYRAIMSFNLALILLGVFGVLPPATGALLHNGFTVAIGLRSMTRLLEDKREETIC